MSAPLQTLRFVRNYWANVKRMVGDIGEYRGVHFSAGARSQVQREAPQVLNAIDGAIRAYEDAEARHAPIPPGTSLAAIRAAFSAMDRVRAILLRDMAVQLWDEMNRPMVSRIWDSLPPGVRETLQREFPNFVWSTGLGLGMVLGGAALLWFAVQAFKRKASR